MLLFAKVLSSLDFCAYTQISILTILIYVVFQVPNHSM